MVWVSFNWASETIFLFPIQSVSLIFMRNAIDCKWKSKKQRRKQKRVRVNKKLIFPFSYFILSRCFFDSEKWVKIKYNLSRFNAENFAFSLGLRLVYCKYMHKGQVSSLYTCKAKKAKIRLYKETGSDFACSCPGFTFTFTFLY